MRVADRYAVIFIPVTLAIAGGAWLLSGDPVRALAVLVVATPCPLILAVPIAVVAGISRAARRGIIVKGGGALETLAHGQVLLFDKTGHADVRASRRSPTSRCSADMTAGGAASARGLPRPGVAARPGGVDRPRGARARARAWRSRPTWSSSTVPGSRARSKAGTSRWGRRRSSRMARRCRRRARDVRRRTALDGSSCVFVAVDGAWPARSIIDDPIRPDSPRVIRTLRRAGIKRVVMVTGDHPDVAESVGAALGRRPGPVRARSRRRRCDAVEAEREEGVTIFVGDGLNDAPGARGRRRGRRDGRPRGHGVVGGGGHRPDRRPAGSDRRGDRASRAAPGGSPSRAW